jgi:hypothetical protein
LAVLLIAAPVWFGTFAHTTGSISPGIVPLAEIVLCQLVVEPHNSDPPLPGSRLTGQGSTFRFDGLIVPNSLIRASCGAWRRWLFPSVISYRLRSGSELRVREHTWLGELATRWDREDVPNRCCCAETKLMRRRDGWPPAAPQRARSPTHSALSLKGQRGG